MKSKVNPYTGIMIPITYDILFIVSGITLYLANMLFPTKVVLGTLSITPLWAIIFSMGILSLLNTFLLPLIREYENKIGKMITDKDWMIIYFFANFIGIWIITRFAEQIGFGVSSWVTIVVLAATLDVVQGMTMMFVEKFRSKK